MNEALLVSSVAPAMKTLYESIKSRSLAHLTIHNLPLELQLPPHLDALLHSTDDDEFAERDETEASDGVNTWGPEFSIAWRLPALEPWKSLLLLSGPDNPGHEWTDVYAAIRGTNVREEDKLLAEQLIRFLETVDITLSYVCFFCHFSLYDELNSSGTQAHGRGEPFGLGPRSASIPNSAMARASSPRKGR